MNRWRSLVARVRELDPALSDTLLTAALQAAAMVEALLYTFHPDTDRWLYVLGWFVAVTPVGWRRSHPIPSLLCTVAVTSVLAVVLPDQTNTLGGAVVAALLLELYNCALREGGRRMALALLLSAVGIVGTLGFAEGYHSASDVLFLVAFVAAPVALGRALRGRRLLMAALRERAARLEHEREERMAQAAEEERTRIARELHDLVAHSVSQMTVQAAAVRRVATADPSAAAAGLAAIEQDGRATLTEMRRLLGVLRREDDALALVPQPGLSRLETLVDEVRQAGMAITLDIEGDRAALTPGVDLAAFRIVEEAIAGARARGSDGPLHVHVRYGDTELELAVGDESAAGAATAFLAGDGVDVLGLRERVALYGGTIEAGAAEEGGVALRALLPLEPVRT